MRFPQTQAIVQLQIGKHEMIITPPFGNLTRRLFGYNRLMSGYKFFHPIEVRYGDLDPQRHVKRKVPMVTNAACPFLEKAQCVAALKVKSRQQREQ